MNKQKSIKYMILLCIIGLILCGSAGCVRQKKVQPEILWVNGTYAVLTELNGGDYTLLGGMKANEFNKQLELASLEEWWDVTDRASADETLNWLLDTGHRSDYASLMQVMEEDDASGLEREELAKYLSEIAGDEEEAYYLINAYDNYLNYGAGAIDGWDYCRAVSLCGWYYIAGYYTEQEALDKSLEIAQTIQKRFSSWDEMMDSYLRGYEYWSYESGDARREIYEDIKTRDNNPYLLDWYLPLT
ncbi:DUF1266 domain-containing protein [Lacrimispora celerecrescens]|uniref:Uncharacterized protein DUF1266 n=1 Tax=[Clostridium] celerecrescens 18A TaxID=1286362 RepID=A0A2M8Z764_9FIRM|nr:DUF1266 domain-containing protein [Lacrimispora celerecrescens]PJJ29271.1 uncharacterized protein DUF1266 [[Clostridium] celerecrescens 18A]